MARQFVSSSTQRVVRDSAVATAVPITMACWYKPTTSAAVAALVSISASVGDQWFALGVTSAAKPFAEAEASSTAGDAIHGTSVTNGTYGHLCARFTGNADRDIFFNGGTPVNNTTSKTPSAGSLDRTSVAALPNNSTVTAHANGHIAEAAIWNVALTNEEVDALAAGLDPRLIRPASLIYYEDFRSDSVVDRDLMGGAASTVNGTPAYSDHPRIAPAIGTRYILDTQSGIRVVGVTGMTAAASGSVTVTLPGGLQENDVLYICFGRRGANGTDTPSITMSEIATGSTGGGIGVMKVFRAVLGSSPPSSVVITTDSTVGVFAGGIVLRGEDATTPEDVVGSVFTSSTTASNPTLTTPSMDIATADAKVVLFTFLGIDSGGTPFTVPAAFEHTIFNASNTAGNNASLGLFFDNDKRSTGATGTVSVTTSSLSSTRGASVQVAVKPAAPPGGGANVDLSFTSDGTSSSTFTLGRARPLSMSSDGTSASTFVIARARALSLTSAGTSTSTFGLKRLRTCGLTSAGTSTSTFGLKRLRSCSLTSAGTSTSTFGLKRLRTCGLTSTGTSTSTFALKTARSLAFSSTGTSTSTFTLRTLRKLTFTSAGTSTSSFALTTPANPNHNLDFTSAGTSTSTFGLQVIRKLTFTSAGASTSTFGLRRLRRLTLTSAGTSTSTFTLRRARALSLSSIGISADSFNLKVIRCLAFLSTGVSADTFGLQRIRLLSFTSAGSSTSTFVLGRARVLSFTSDGTSTSTFNVEGRGGGFPARGIKASIAFDPIHKSGLVLAPGQHTAGLTLTKRTARLDD